MVHGIEVHLMANIEKYKQGMEAAKKIGGESMGFIASIFDKVKSLAGGIWESIKGFFSNIGEHSKSASGSMSASIAGAFEKIKSMLPGFHGDLDKTQAKMGETEEKSDGMAKKIGLSVVAAIVAATAAIAVFVKKGLEADMALAKFAATGDLAVSQISRFEAVAAKSNVSAQEFGGSMLKLRAEMAKAAAGDGNSFFDKLGIKVVDANNALLKTDEVTIAVAKKIAGMSTEAEKYAAAAKLGFEGKVQVLEDIARASDLSATTTDDQAAAVVRLGKIWHDILPGGKSMWAQIGAFLTTSLTPAMTEASVTILTSKNTIVDAFNQIFGTGSMFPALGEKIKDWSTQATQWFAKVAQTATGAAVSIMQFLAQKTGMGDPNAYKPTVQAVPGLVPLVKETGDAIKKDAEKKQAEEYKELTKAINEKIEVQNLEIKTGATLSEGQRLQIKTMMGLRDGTLSMTDAEKTARNEQINTLIAKEKLSKQVQEARKSAAAEADAEKAAAAAAQKKEEAAYAGLISSIKEKTAANLLEAAAGVGATESQKASIKIDQELASGKLKLSTAHIENARATIVDQAASEQLLKTQKVEKDVLDWIIQSTMARNASKDALAAEYAMYGKSNDARDIAMIAIKSEAELEKYLADARKDGKPIVEAQLRLEKEKRDQVEQTALAQTKALGYAAGLAAENKKFAAEAIGNDRDRAAALLEIDADMWRERITLAGDGTEAQKALQTEFGTWYANQSIKPQIEANKAMWKSVDQTAHDTFVNVFQSGKGAFDKLRDTLKSGLLDLLYQMTIKKWIFNIGAEVSGTAGMAGAAGAAMGGQGSAGGASSLIGTASTANSLYKGGTAVGNALLGSGSGTVASWMAGTSAVAPTSVLAANAVGAVGGDALGTLIAAEGWTTAAAAAGTSAGATAGAAAGVAASSTAAGGVAAGGATAGLAAIPVYGWVALAAIAAYAIFSGNDTEKNTRLAFGSNNAAGNISINERGNEGKPDAYINDPGKSAFGTFGVTSTFWMSAGQPVVQDFIKTVAQTDDALAGFLTSAEKASVTANLTGKTSIARTGEEGADPSAGGQLDKVFQERIHNIFEGIEPGLASLTDGFKGTSAQLATESGALLQYRVALRDSGQAIFGAKVTLQDLAALKLPTEATSVAINRIGTEFSATNAVADALGISTSKAFGAVGLASLSARENLILLSGGVTNLGATTASYSANFLTESEKLAPSIKALDEAMAALGLTGVTTKDQFKAAVTDLANSGALATEAGAKQLAGLMAVNGTFAQVATAREAVAKEASDKAEAKLSARRALEIQVMEAQGNAIGATKARREGEIEALTKTNPELVALQKNLYAAQDAATGIADGNALLALQARLYAANGDKAGAAAVLLKQQEAALVGLSPAMAAATREAVKAETAQTALATATAEAATAAAAAATLTKANRSLEIEILGLMGDKLGALAASRKDEMVGMDASTAALTRNRNAFQDQATAASTALSNANLAIGGLKNAVGAEKGRIDSAYQDQVERANALTTDAIKAAQESMDSAKTKVGSIKSVFDKLNSALASTAVQSDALDLARRRAAQGLLANAAASTAGGGTANIAGLDDALATLAKPSEQLFSSFEEYSRDQARTGATIAALQANATKELNYGQLTVDGLDGTVTTIQNAAKDQLKQMEQQHQQDLAKQDALITTAQADLDATLGLGTAFGSGLMTVSEALRQVAAAIGAVKSTPAPLSVQGAYQQVLGRAGEKAGVDFWTAAYGDSVDSTELADFIKAAGPELAARNNGTLAEFLRAHNVPGFAGGGAFGGGIRVVGENGPELEVTGPSRIINNADLFQRLSSPASNNAELVAEVRLLRKEIAELKAPMEQTAANTGNAATSTGQLAEQFDRATEGGNALRTELVSDLT